MAEKKTASKTTSKTAKTRGSAGHARSRTYTHSEVACDNCKLSDYDIISDVLGGHKNLVKLYGTALCETDSESLRRIINTQMTECASDQYDAFRYMNDRGMYKVETAPAQKVKSARAKFGKNIECFGCGASKIK